VKKLDFEKIKLDKADSTPLYRQLAEQLKAAIRRGDLPPGQKLPPIRAWKEKLAISPVTANQAYGVLGVDGFAVGQVGRGTFARLPQTPPLAVGPTAEGEAPLAVVRPGHSSAPFDFPGHYKADRLAQVQRALNLSIARHQAAGQGQDLIVLTSGAPAQEVFQLDRWRSAMNRAGESFEQESHSFGKAQLQYGPPLGDFSTRQWLAGYLARFGFQPDPDEILLTTGSQQALDLLSRVLAGPGDNVLVESPSYVSALEIFENRGVNWLPVPLDDRGMLVDRIAQLAERYRPRLLYTIPTAQSPTGITLAPERRKQLVELAERYNFWIIEDDTCSEFYYESETLVPAVKSYDQPGRVIYLKSFSKLIFPAVRFGLITAQRPIMEKLAEAKAVFDRGVSLPLARSVMKFAGAPAFERELAAARLFYRERRDALLAGFSVELSEAGCSWSKCEAGFSIQLTLPEDIRAAEFHLAAAENGVAVLPGPIYYPLMNENRLNTVRVSFGDNSPQRLREACRRLGVALRSLNGRQFSLPPGAPFITAV
jgi:DNA-binding transcriptional MocR family regulator